MRALSALATGALALASAACTPLTLSWANLDGAGPKPTPPVFADFKSAPTLAEWEAEKPKLQRLLEEHVYGFLPDASKAEVLEHKVLDEAAFGGLGRLEEYVVSLDATFDGVTTSTRDLHRAYVVDLLLPVAVKGPAPVIMMETFCPRWATIPHEKVARPAGVTVGGPAKGWETYVFGRYICTPPIEEILQRGYGVAAIFPGEIAPDNAESGLAALNALGAGHADANTRWGAIAAWAWVFSRTIDVLETNPRVDPHRLITWGHSRYAKAALVAAAYDPRVAAVIAHQSGTGGASLSKHKKGESVKSITKNYPHWFAQNYAAAAGHEDDLPVDQHQLLALIAPRPILLGNARRDVWSDPSGAYRAAQGADPVYKLYGAKGLTQKSLRGFDPKADLSFWIRPGTHGVVKEDWPAFFDFLDAHVGPAAGR